ARRRRRARRAHGGVAGPVAARPEGLHPGLRSGHPAVVSSSAKESPLAGTAQDAPPGRTTKTSLAHLPQHKQDVLRAVAEVVRAGAPLEMLILFGSHARGDWVEDPEGGYFSDYDLLAVVESRKVADDAALWSRIETEARALSGDAIVSLI